MSGHQAKRALSGAEDNQSEAKRIGLAAEHDDHPTPAPAGEHHGSSVSDHVHQGPADTADTTDNVMTRDETASSDTSSMPTTAAVSDTALPTVAHTGLTPAVTDITMTDTSLPAVSDTIDPLTEVAETDDSTKTSADTSAVTSSAHPDTAMPTSEVADAGATALDGASADDAKASKEVVHSALDAHVTEYSGHKDNEKSYLHLRAWLHYAQDKIVTGPDGEIMTKLLKDTGLRFTLSAIRTGIHERIVTFIGPPSAAALAVSILKSELDKHPKKRHQSIDLLCPEIMTRSALDEETVELIQRKSGAEVAVSCVNVGISTERPVSVYGDAAAVKSAVLYVATRMCHIYCTEYEGLHASFYADRNDNPAQHTVQPQVIPHKPSPITGPSEAPKAVTPWYPQNAGNVNVTYPYGSQAAATSYQPPASYDQYYASQTQAASVGWGPGGTGMQQTANYPTQAYSYGPNVQAYAPQAQYGTQMYAQHQQAPPENPLAVEFPTDYDPPTVGPAATYRDGQESLDPTGRLIKTIWIANDSVGAIIGKGGGKINEMRSKTQAFIKVHEPVGQTNDRQVTVSGLHVNVRFALWMLWQRLDSEKRRG